MQEPPLPRKFEDCIEEIRKILEHKRFEWTFKASVMKDFDDIKAEIEEHIWTKWNLYDQSRPLGAWVATILKNKWANALRDIYTSTASPCVRCKMNLGSNRCKLFGNTESQECNVYTKWYKVKRHTHNAKLPVSIEDKLNEVSNQPDSFINLESAANNLHKRMQTKLTSSEWEIYKRLFVLQLSEEETAAELGFKTSEHGRKMGNKRIRHVKKLIVKKAKEVIAEYGVETII